MEVVYATVLLCASLEKKKKSNHQYDFAKAICIVYKYYMVFSMEMRKQLFRGGKKAPKNEKGNKKVLQNMYKSTWKPNYI